VTSPKSGRRREPPGSSGASHTATARRSRRVSETGARGEYIVRRPPCSRTRLCVRLAVARFELSAQAHNKLGGALNTSHPPPRPRASAAPCWPIVPSTELVARAPCQLRRAHARPVRAARARLRQQRRLEVDKSRKRDVQTGAPQGALERGRGARTRLFPFFSPSPPPIYPSIPFRSRRGHVLLGAHVAETSAYTFCLHFPFFPTLPPPLPPPFSLVFLSGEAS